MEKFEISSDDCLILKAFKEAHSLREAAKLLNCDPAGLARRVQSISSQYGFLQKVDNRWHLTGQGLDLVAWTESSIQTQKKILSAKSALRIGTTMWFAEEALIPDLLKLKQSLGQKFAIHLLVPQQGFERALLDGSVDFVIACHPPENPEIEHKKLFEEDWVIVTPPEWKISRNPQLHDLKDRAFIRHSGINTDLFAPGIENYLESDIKIDNLVGIRAAVRAGLGWSIVPKISVIRHLNERLISAYPLDFKIRDRNVCLWWLRNRFEIKRKASKVASWLNAMEF